MATKTDPDAVAPISRPRFTPHPTADEAFEQADSVWAWMDEMTRAADEGRTREWLMSTTDPSPKVLLAMGLQQRAAMQDFGTELSKKASSDEVAALPGLFAEAAFEYQGQLKAEEEETKRLEKSEEEETKRARHRCVSTFAQRIANDPAALRILVGGLVAVLLLIVAGVFFANADIRIGDWFGVSASDVLSE